MIRGQAAFIFCLIGSLAATIIFWAMSSSPHLSVLFRGNNTDGSNHSIRNHNFWTTFRKDTKSSVTTNSTEETANLQRIKDGTRRSTCPDILSGMTKGKWIKRPLTPDEQATIDTYLQDERGAYKIPPTYQREDGLCGNISYDKFPLPKVLWFKAICDPKGITPCCQTTRCVALTEEECRCPTCYDERQSTHAEYAQWKPEDDRFEVKNFTKDEVCKILNGTTLHFVGDSFIRHVFAALVIYLTNGIDGALKTNISSEQRRKCGGMHQITGLTCRDHLDDDRSLCEGSVKIKYTQVFRSKELPIIPSLLETLLRTNKSVLVLSLGIHDNFNMKTVAKQFLLPFLNYHQIRSSDQTSDLKLEEVQMHFDDIDTFFSTTSKIDDRTSKMAGNEGFKTTSPNYGNVITTDHHIRSNSNSERNQLQTGLPSVQTGFNLEGVTSSNKMVQQVRTRRNVNKRHARNTVNGALDLGSNENKENDFSKGQQLDKSGGRTQLSQYTAQDIDFRHGSISPHPSEHQEVGNSSFTGNIHQNSTRIGVKATNSPTEGKATNSPTEGKATNSPTEVKATNSPTEVKATNSPTEVKATNSPTEVKATNSPTEVKATNSPTEFKATNSPTEVKATNSPTDVKATNSPTEVKVTNSPTEVKATNSPTEVKATNSPTEVKATNSPTEVKTTNSPTEVKATNSPTDVKATNSPTEVKTTNSPIIFKSFPHLHLERQLRHRLLWLGTHSPGLMKSPTFTEQFADKVLSYNTDIQGLLSRWKVPYLETFSFTSGALSFDGTHYGWGINMLKVNMLLTYIQSGCLEDV